jgi:hypothetical protein
MNEPTVASNEVLKPSFTIPDNYVGTWGTKPGDLPAGYSVYGAPVVVTQALWNDPPPGFGPNVIPNCVIQTPTGLVYNSPLGQIPMGTPVMSQGKIYLGILGYEAGQVNPSQWANPVGPYWVPLGISPVIPCVIPTVVNTSLALAQKVQAELVQALTDVDALIESLGVQ